MDQPNLPASVEQLKQSVDTLSHQVDKLYGQAAAMAVQHTGAEQTFLVMGITVFVLAIFVGYYVVWHVTPALHSPLMSVTNAISSVIVVGALIAAGPVMFGVSQIFGLAAIVLASINIFGGFIVSQRMLAMFRKKK
jgi:H+-translocating NAD(P) transhydrogenase subunit alpha